MPDKQTSKDTQPKQPHRRSISWLAVLVLLGSVGLGFWLVVDHLTSADEGRNPLQDILPAVALILAGATAAVMIQTASAATDRTRSADRSPEDRPTRAEGKPGSEAHTGRPDDVAEKLDEALSLLREIAENSLLNDEQRRQKLQRRRDRARRETINRVEDLIRDGRFEQARKACNALVDRYGPDAGIDDLIHRVEQARATAEAEDIQVAKKRVADLVSLAAWENAEHVASALVSKYPNSQAARELRRSVDHERITYEEQQRRRLMNEIDRLIQRKQWREALETAEKLLQRFDGTPEADTVKPQLETLRANAEIQERQTLESQIKELIKRHRFAEAVELANKVIERYPTSPQADALRSQLPRLETKAAQAQSGSKA